MFAVSYKLVAFVMGKDPAADIKARRMICLKLILLNPLLLN